MRLDDLPESGNIEDRRDGGGGGGFGLPIGGGGLGIGTIVVLGLIGWAFGIDPSLLIGGAEISPAPISLRFRRRQRRVALASHRMRQVVSSIACSAQPRSDGKRSSPRMAERIGLRCLSCIVGKPLRSAGRRFPPWARSIVPPIRRFISTPRSSIRSRPDFAAVILAANRVSSPRRT